MTRLSLSHSKLPEVGKYPVDTAYDVGSVVSVLAGVGSSSQLRSVVSLWFLLMALDVWKEVSGVESMLATLLCRSGHSSDCTILAIICVPGTSDPLRRYTLPSVIPLLPTPSNYHIAPTEVAADTSIRPTCFSEAYYTALSKSVSCSYCRRLRLRGILSLNIVYQSHQIRLDSRTALVLMLLNSPSCATDMRIAHSLVSLASKFFNHLHISYQTTFLPSFVIVA
ncbi:hypothetical protein TNCV_4658141 [Trichonephila clavipes]|nr:hypothetical protein TNCV_4658141 [Trichonephila clavipes]